MASEITIETDVLVVGGGIAGCFAAIKAKDKGLDVVIVDKAYVAKSGGTAAAGAGAGSSDSMTGGNDYVY